MTAGTGRMLDDLRRLRGGVTADDDDRLTEIAGRVAWSVVAEPGDSVAGVLLEMLGAADAMLAVTAAVDDGPGALVARCVETGAVPPDELQPFTERLLAAIDRWRPRVRQLAVDRTLATARAFDAGLVVPGDPAWPTGFDDLGPHAPAVVWTRGAVPPDTGAALAIVGSRANTVPGAGAAAEIASRAVDAACTVVSGGAYGIDAVAHRVAISGAGRTVALLAGGVDQLYPAGHVELLRGVMANGVVLAESPPGTRPSRWRFLARNRLIAALADATVVVEAGARSGALNTAHHAVQLGRPVFAVPGPLTSAASVGCHRLVASGRAQLVVHHDDPVRAAVAARRGDTTGGDTTPALTGAVEDPDVLRVTDALGRRRSLGIEEIARRSGLSPADVTAALALAELQGVVRRDHGGWSRAA